MEGHPRDWIERKRDGHALSGEAIAAFARAVTDGGLSDAQVGAMLMAMWLRGLSRAECVALTAAMRDSGGRLARGASGRPRVDKHSTGGVGDKVSLVLAPLAAACGVDVPMISGRGLGHTGGTLDKLESVPGFRTALDGDAIDRQIAELGAVIVGQTDDFVPADRRLYAIRDVTGTVESLPLIVASILSKKLAEDLDGLVLDVKHGAGAFFQDPEQSRELALELVSVAGELGVPAIAVRSAMDRPLGRSVGNALEVAEAVRCLRGEGPADLEELCLTLSAEMVALGCGTPLEESRRTAAAALRGGAALERFRQMVAAQGGDPGVADDPARLPVARRVWDVLWPEDGAAGYVAGVDARRVAGAANCLGAGRRREDAGVDPAVGVADLIATGAPIAPGTVLGRLHVNDEASLQSARQLLREAVTVSESPVDPPPLITEILRPHATDGSVPSSGHGLA